MPTIITCKQISFKEISILKLKNNQNLIYYVFSKPKEIEQFIRLDINVSISRLIALTWGLNHINIFMNPKPDTLNVSYDKF